jgi:hypothetical protein
MSNKNEKSDYEELMNALESNGSVGNLSETDVILKDTPKDKMLAELKAWAKYMVALAVFALIVFILIQIKK